MATLIEGERLAVKAAAERFGIHVNTIYRWSRVGHKGRRLRLVRFGGRTFVRLADLESFVEALSDPPPAEETEKERGERAKRATAYLDSQGL